MMKFISPLMFLTTALAAGFSYNQCDNTTGPAAWPGTCQSTTALQTPINLCGAVAFNGAAPTLAPSGYSTARDGQSLKVFNNGYTIQMNVASNPPTLQAGTLATTVGRSTSTTAPTWVLAQMHVHFGRTGKNNEGSEHYMQGVAYPFELHLVHYNQQYGSLGSAVGQSDGLLVVGIFFQIGSTDVPLMTTMSTNVPSMTQTPTNITGTATISDVFDGTGAFYSYAGGLTTPNCNAVVTWVVMKTPKSMTQNTLNNFKSALANPPVNSSFTATSQDLIALYGNFRPLQNLNGRIVFASDGVSAACGTVTQPDFACSTSNNVVPGAGIAISPSFFIHGFVLFLSVSINLLR